jgi:hypothetical protein
MEKGPVAPAEFQGFYARRAIDIVRAGLASDFARLRTMVSPDAGFEIWRGDYSTSARSSGPEGLARMARDIDARSFSVSVVQSGPIVITATDCKAEVTILFRGEASHGAIVTFSFVDGVLTGAKGNGVDLIEGKIP